MRNRLGEPALHYLPCVSGTSLPIWHQPVWHQPIWHQPIWHQPIWHQPIHP